MIAGSSSARPTPDFTLLAVGDFGFPSGNYDRQVDANGPAFLDEIRPFLKQADARFLNLETTVTDRPFAVKKEYLFRMPIHRLEWVIDAGFNLLSLANNHMADAGEAGVDDTTRNIGRVAGKRKVAWAGAGENLKGDDLDVDGGTVRLIAVKCGTRGILAGPGAWVDQGIRAARKAGKTVVVSAHCGDEYSHQPRPDIVRLYRGWVDSGADLVIGHHPHVVQGVEARGHGLILYSLGNFAFATMTVRHHKTGARMYGMLAMVDFRKGRPHRLRLIPLWVNNSEPLEVGGKTMKPAAFKPLVGKGVFASHMLKEFQEFSRTIPGNATDLAIDGDEAVLSLEPAREKR